MEKIGRAGRELLEYLLNDACETARAVIDEFPESTKEGVSKRTSIYDEYFRLQDKYAWEEEGEIIPQLSMLTHEDFKQYFMVERVIWAYEILGRVEALKKEEADFTKLEPGYLGANMYFIGMYHAQIMEIDVMIDSAIMNKSRALLHGEIIKNSRWASHNKPFEDALKLADELWSTGDTRMHHEMVGFVMEQIEEFRSIADADSLMSVKRRLLKDIGSLAKEKYPGRFFLPGKSKNDNPY